MQTIGCHDSFLLFIINSSGEAFAQKRTLTAVELAVCIILSLTCRLLQGTHYILTILAQISSRQMKLQNPARMTVVQTMGERRKRRKNRRRGGRSRNIQRRPNTKKGSDFVICRSRCILFCYGTRTAQ